MSSPGGREVGRVSIRVVPDSEGFRRDLQRELEAVENSLRVTIPVDFDVDTAALRAQIEGINARVTVPVDFDVDVDAATLRAQLEALSGGRITIPVDLDIDIGALQAQLQALDSQTVNIRVSIDGVALALAELAALDAAVRDLDGRTININADVDIAAALAQIAALQAAITALGNINLGGGGGGGIGGGGFGRGGVFGQIASAIAAALVLAPALAVAGAGVTAAWGAVSTAIAAVPGALALLAAPIATVAIGFDGVKEAARTLKPEFEKLQTLLNATFLNGLTPVFEQLGGVFPTLTTGLHDIAHAVVGVADNLTGMLTSFSGLLLIRGLLDGVATALQNMAPGISNITEALLIVGSRSSAFDALSEAVNRFGTAFRQDVLNLMASGTLDAAFRGLGDVLGELAEGFSSLVTNGIEVFAAAAPGVTSFLDDLSGFFNRFDFASLGASVGAVFEGLGTALEGVPTETFREIEESFKGLGEVFKSQSFQSDLQTMIGGIPEAIDAIGALTSAFADIGGKIALGFEALDLANTRFAGFIEGLNAAADDFTVPPQAQKFFQDFDTILDTGFEQITGISAAEWDGVAQVNATGAAAAGAAGAAGAAAGFAQTGTAGAAAATGAFGSIEGAVGAAGAAVTGTAGSSLSGVPGVVEGALAPIPETTLAILQQIAPIIERSFNGLSVFAAIGMNRVATAVQNGGPVIANALRVGLLGLEQVVVPALGLINQQFQLYGQVWGVTLAAALSGLAGNATAGMVPVQAAITAALTAVNATIIASVGVWALSVQLGFQRITTAVTTGMASLGPAVTLGLTAVNASIIAGVGVWALSVQLGMLNVTTAITAGFAGVGAAAAAGLAAINGVIIAGVGVWALSATFGMQGVTSAVTAGFTGISAAAAAGLAAVNGVIIAGVSVWAASVRLGFATINAAVTGGFVNVGAAVAIGMAAGNSAITAGMASWVAAITSSMAVIVSAVRVGVAQMSVAVSTGFSAIAAAAAAGMAAVNSRVIAGMSSLRASVQIGISGAVATLNGAVGQFRAAGSNMGAALAAGLNSQVGAVQAAAARLANAAAAATRAAAAIRSPSRVFMQLGDYMGQGIAIGLDQSHQQIIRSARDLVDDVVSETARLQSVFTAPSDLSGWAAGFEAQVRASVTQTGVGAAGGMTPGDAELLAAVNAQTRALLAVLRANGRTPSAVTAREMRAYSEAGVFT